MTQTQAVGGVGYTLTHTHTTHKSNYLVAQKLFHFVVFDVAEASFVARNPAYTFSYVAI